MKPQKRLFLSGLLVVTLAWSSAVPLAWSAPDPLPPAAGAPDPEDPEEGLYRPRSLDGVLLEAVENYPNLSDSSLGLGLGIYPFNAYYSALLVNLNYVHRLSRTWQWELLNVNYAYTFDKDLTTELADRFGVEPRVIDRFQFLVSTNLLKTLAHGKFIFMDDHIRYFTTSFILGAGLAKSSQKSAATANFGFRGEIFTSDRFSWRIDARDQFDVANMDHIVTFTLSTGLSF